MKKLLTFASAFLTAATLLAANPGDNAFVRFWTDGPDTYKDGSPVIVGETYLLVYVKPGAAFGGVDTKGRLVDTENNAIVRTVQAEADSEGRVHCPYGSLNYSTTTDYPEGGSFYVVLLDTRVDADAAGGLAAGYTMGAATTASLASINQARAVKDAAGSQGTNAMGESAVYAESAGPADDPLRNAPEITGITSGEGGATLTLDKLQKGHLYTVKESTSLSSGDWKEPGVTRAQGVEGETSVTVPASSAKVRFFKVFVNN